MKRVSQAGFGVQKAIAVLCATGLLASTTLAQANPTLPSAPAASAAISAPDHRTAGASFSGAAGAGYQPGTFPH